MLTKTNVCSVQNFLGEKTVCNCYRNIGQFLCGAERVMRFVYVNLHCIVSNLKRISKNFLHPWKKFFPPWNNF